MAPEERPESRAEIMRGGSARVVENMEASLGIPTATSYRTIAVKLLEENRRFINEHLESGDRGKVSFTHIIAWAIVRALRSFPAINASFDVIDGEPHRRVKPAINLGIAVDSTRKDGTRTLLVPNIKNADKLHFQEFLQSYDSIINRVRKGVLVPEDFQDTTITLTNPGTVGTAYLGPASDEGPGRRDWHRKHRIPAGIPRLVTASSFESGTEQGDDDQLHL